MNSNRPVVAVFDFDGTLTDRHTFWRFLRLVAGPVKFWAVVLTMIPWIIGIYYRGASIMSAREVLIRRLLKGLEEKRFNDLAEQFARHHIPAWIRADARAAIERHQRHGSVLMLISNSAEVYLKPWAASAGLPVVYGSRFATDAQGRLTGELLGTHCQGMEKLRCMERHLGNLCNHEIHVYGDSEGDVDMLRAADFAYYLTFDAIHCNDQRRSALAAAAIA